MSAPSAEEHKATVRRFVDELYNKGNIAVVYENMAPDYINHTARPPIAPDREGFVQEALHLRIAFPDLRFTVEDLLVEGDKGVMRWTMTGTHGGDFYGIAPTHKQVTFSGLNIWRVRGNKEFESWSYAEDLHLFQQLGVLPHRTTAPQTVGAQTQAQA